MLLNETVPQWVIDITVDVSIMAVYYLFIYIDKAHFIENM